MRVGRSPSVLPSAAWGAALACLTLAAIVATTVGADLPLAAGPAAPRLIVLVVIDQFREEYVDRFRDRFGHGGFRRLQREGARFTACLYPFALTETAPGYATLVTGTTPDRHGIVSNAWYDRDLGRMVTAIEDREFPYVGTREAKESASPRRLLGETFSDVLLRATGGRARVFGVALKARAAVLSCAHASRGAFWYDTDSGRFVSSRYYGRALPDWVAAFNAKRPADRFRGRVWSSHGLTLARLPEAGLHLEDRFYEALQSTPYSHDLLFDFTQQLIEHERLGEDEVTDLLFIGLSAHDYLGHDTGPDSEAVAAMSAATDGQLAAFLRYLDGHLGRSGYWLGLSADHGIGPTLEQAEARGLQPVAVNRGRIRERIQRALRARFGTGDDIRLLGETTRIWFDHDVLARRRVKIEEAARIAGEAALDVPGIKGYVAPGATNLDAGMVEAFRRSTYAGRSPDLFLLLAPYAVLRDTSAANHGTPWDYDAQVPLLLYGKAFKAGTYRDRCSPADLVPTLAAALGIQAPAQATGRVLRGAIVAAGNVP